MDDTEIDDGAGTDMDENTLADDLEVVRSPTPIQAPKFITRIKDTKVRKGQTALFECVVPDTKGVCVKWLKDGKEISLIARIRVSSAAKNGQLVEQLIVDDAQLEDMGVYTAVVTNAAGEDRCEATLTVERGMFFI
jgi:hypothetical protein